MTRALLPIACILALCSAAPTLRGQPPAATQEPPAQQQSQVDLIIGGRIGARPTFAVPDCLAPAGDEALAAAGRTVAEVLWNDLEFEREFRMMARDTYDSIPRARSLEAIPYDRWLELGVDGVVSCRIEADGDGRMRLTARLFSTRSRSSAFGVEYSGSRDNLRLYAHQLSDEIHREQRGLRGVARTKIAFVSDRDSESVLGLVEDRQTKEIYFVDYDGENVQRVTVSRSLNTTPQWAPGRDAIAYTSWRRGAQDVFVSRIFEGRLASPAGGSNHVHNWLPAWSPDGSQLAFTSNRDGNPELYISNADGSDVRRLTNHPGIDTTPTWSPQGHQIAFTSDRTGSPQIYVIGVDGTGLRRITFESYCDRPTWSPAPYNEIAYSSRTGPGHDIKVVDLATNEVRQLTFGQGSNESPSYSPNGRHLAFTSTRGEGSKQIWLIGRDGRGLRRLTSRGNNEMPSWSQ